MFPTPEMHAEIVRQRQQALYADAAAWRIHAHRREEGHPMYATASRRRRRAITLLGLAAAALVVWLSLAPA
jgi:hypothetical protein